MILEILLASHLHGSGGTMYDAKGNRLGEIRERNGRYGIYQPDGTRKGYGQRAPASPSTIETFKPDGTRDQNIKIKEEGK